MMKPRHQGRGVREALPLFAHAMRAAPAAMPRAPYVSTGLASVDALTGGGFASKRLTLVAARPKTGASSLLLGATLEALRREVAVLYVSEHLNEAQLRGRLVVLEARVNGYRFRAGLASREDKIALAAARERIGWHHLTLLARPGLDTSDLESAIFSYHPALVVADLLPRPEGSAPHDHRFATLVEGARALAELARRHGTAVVMRLGLPEGGVAPEAAELPGQGAFLDVVDTALLMHRDEVTTPKGGDVEAAQGLAELMLVRLEGRNISPEHVRLRFDQRYAGLADL